jgi:prefoldin subunit 5
MNQTEQTYQQLQARIDELEAQYQTLQDSYDDEVLLCVSLLRTLVDDDHDYCESLVKRADCSVERKADTLQFIADVRDGYC